MDPTTLALIISTIALVSVAAKEWSERSKINYRDLMYVYMLGPSESMARIKRGDALEGDTWAVSEFWTVVVAMFRRGMLPRFFWDPEEPFYMRARDYVHSKASSEMTPVVRDVLQSIMCRKRDCDKRD